MIRSLTLVLGCATLVSACSSPRGIQLQSIAPDINATLYVGEERIGPGDVLEVKFSSQADLNQEVSVQLDGHASFLDIGTILVAGHLPGELGELLLEKYKAGRESVRNLVVVIKTSASKSFHVMGEVRAPGTFDLDNDGQVTLLEALSRAGGHIKASSWLGNTLLVRYDPETKQQRSWILDMREEHWGGPQPIWIQEHDVLFIPNTRIDDAGIVVDMWIKRMIPWPNVVVPGV